MKRYIYHYCAKYQTTPGQFVNIDGIALLESRITNNQDYMNIKPLIEPEHHDKLTIISLAFLGIEKT
ncbi:hypothetical protein [Pseudoalteromonas sp. BDTF-M6]|uniref:hypothetical protein n=1 Tax=Pseudoalteromonas sp. BDTF-M6 TaxID=2796132 RepID=UPI001BB000EC|nr:hypothetical protein [Pseudoalteromonas sp. BDTF-M6]MBS3796682.1 hypothetical protein [Pseudoalteromonas sp. BDTF-M6]